MALVVSTRASGETGKGQPAGAGAAVTRSHSRGWASEAAVGATRLPGQEAAVVGPDQLEHGDGLTPVEGEGGPEQVAVPAGQGRTGKAAERRQDVVARRLLFVSGAGTGVEHPAGLDLVGRRMSSQPAISPSSRPNTDASALPKLCHRPTVKA